MLQRAAPFARLAFMVIAVTVGCATGLTAQTPSRPWKLTAAFTGLRVGGSTKWVYGPELGLRRDIGARWGLGLRASLPILDTAPFSDDGAAALDFGPTLTFMASDRGELGLAAGVTAFLVGDAGELTDGGIGAFADAHGTVWVTPALGVTAGAAGRIASGNTVYPSLSAGLALRF